MKYLPVPIRDLARFSGPLPKYFTKEEVHRILDQAKTDRDHLLIELLWRTGARISEALSIKAGDIDIYAKAIKIRTLKQRSNSFRVVPIPRDLLNELQDYVKAKNLLPEDKLFDLSRGGAHFIIMNICLKADIDRKRAHPHTFRHSFAIHATLNRVPIGIIQEWLGHSNIANTMIYGRVLAQDTKQFMEDIEW